MSGRNIGDLLNDKHVTWGWSKAARPNTRNNGTAFCDATSVNLIGKTVTDYSPHHEPFQYYPRTANPHHLPPSSVAMIGGTDQANHQYDLADFYDALAQGHLAGGELRQGPQFQDGHAGLDTPTHSTSRPHLVG